MSQSRLTKPLIYDCTRVVCVRRAATQYQDSGMHHTLADGSCSPVRLRGGSLDNSAYIARILVNEWRLAGQKSSTEPSSVSSSDSGSAAQPTQLGQRTVLLVVGLAGPSSPERISSVKRFD